MTSFPPDSPAPVAVKSLRSERLSFYRTEHEFQHYGEFTCAEEFIALKSWAKTRRVPLFILGGGSNVLFKRKRIETLVLKNKLPRTIQEIDPRTIEASSSSMVAQVLAWCQERQLDSFYYLASVPATVGGAIAMNAGRGRLGKKSIYDFVESITILQGTEVRRLLRAEIPISYRETPFTGKKDQLILSAVFRFPPLADDGNPRRERIAWSQENQDHSAPNCGSVFKEYDRRILGRLKGVRIYQASYSPKTLNWILNFGNRSWPIVWLIRLTKLLHRLAGKKAHLELIEVE